MYAVFGDARGNEKILFTLQSPPVYICTGIPSDELETARGSTLAPVYQVDGQGPPSIPTGNILVRLAPGRYITEIRNELEKINYTLNTVLSYAPHAGWVQARSGKLEDALRGLQNLANLSGVEHAEPQMLSQLVKK